MTLEHTSNSVNLWVHNGNLNGHKNNYPDTSGYFWKTLTCTDNFFEKVVSPLYMDNGHYQLELLEHKWTRGLNLNEWIQIWCMSKSVPATQVLSSPSVVEKEDNIVEKS